MEMKWCHPGSGLRCPSAWKYIQSIAFREFITLASSARHVELGRQHSCGHSVCSRGPPVCLDLGVLNPSSAIDLFFPNLYHRCGEPQMKCSLLQECATSESGAACRSSGGKRHILPRNVSLTPSHSLGIKAGNYSLLENHPWAFCWGGQLENRQNS